MGTISPRDRPIIEVRNLRKEYPLGSETVVALGNINLQIMRGEICCIFGTSGSGKSTLLNQLAGMEKPTRGEVRIGGACVSRMNENELAAFRQNHLGFVFQAYNLLPYLTITENVAMPLMFRGVPRAKREKMARQKIKMARQSFSVHCRAIFYGNASVLKFMPVRASFHASARRISCWCIFCFMQARFFRDGSL